MPTFVYTARKRSGEKVEGSIEASDRREALAGIERQGQIPVSVVERSATVPKAGKKRFSFKLSHGQGKMGTRDLLVFTTELSDLLASGMTLGNALNCLSRREASGSDQQVIAGLRDEIIRGTSLSEALTRYPESFPTLYVSMIRAGEASGAMTEVLRRMVSHYEGIQELKEKVTMALVYPVIVLVMGLATMVFAFVYLIPKFKVIFEQLGETLPLPTRILVVGSEWLVKYGWLFLIVVIMAGALFHRAVKTPHGREVWHRALLRAPLMRGVIASGIYANFARTLGTLLNNGVPVLQALGIVEHTVGNVIVGNEIHHARDRVTDGTTISGPLAAGQVFPSIMTDMLAIGEQTGDMTGALSHIARRYENELDRNIKIFTTALEPLLILLVAIMVGFIAIAILMAVFELTSGLNA